ncbi:MAG TPA: hypothetical protein VGK19_18350 [Capsulimonadaceae bacterium]|jgi:hypothetical protein
MGEQFRRKKNERERMLRERAHQDELATATLFSSRPEVYAREYQCSWFGRTPVSLGDTVMLTKRSALGGISGIPAPEVIEVSVGNVVVGTVVGEPAKELISVLDSDPRAAGMVNATVVGLPSLDDTIMLRVAEEHPGSPKNGGKG